jgi:hypothetical protein
MSTWMFSRGRSLLAAASVLALAASLVGDGGATAEAASKAPLKLEAAQATSILTRYEEQDEEGNVFTFVDGTVGIYAVAGSRPFEVRAERDSYSKPIVAKMKRPGKDLRLPTPSNFLGLTDFFTTTITDAAGAEIQNTSSTFCPNSYQPTRRRASAPATSPYPEGCYGNPYSKGAVYGIQAGYAVPAAGDFNEAFQDLPLGEFTVTMTINRAYRKALGLTGAQAKAVVNVRVIPGSFDEEEEELRREENLATPAATEPKRVSGQKVKPKGLRPDLRSLPAWNIDVDEGRYLTFAATVWNAGPGPLVVDGFRRPSNPNLMNAYQYFFSASGKQKGYAPVGTMEWDDRDGHTHWHFTDFAAYNLVGADKKFVARSSKEAFCLANTDAVDYTVKGANWRPSNTDLQTACGDHESLGVREVLDTGSGDTYDQSVPGQSFDLNNLANGTYYIQIKANPEKVLYERSTKNNVSYRKVVIGGEVGARTVKVAKVGIIDEGDRFEEESAARRAGHRTR